MKFEFHGEIYFFIALFMNALEKYYLEDVPAEISILKQLEKICGSSVFEKKKILCKFLRHVVNETLEGRENQIKGLTLGIEVFDKGLDFDPQYDSLVRINAGRLRRALKTYYKSFGENDEVFITIPKGAYIPVFKTNDQKRTEGTAKNFSEPGTVEISDKPHIAILPFKNCSGNVKFDYLSYGIVEELTVELTSYEDLIVYDCVPGSNNLYTHSDINHFIHERNIHYVIDGSVLQSGDRVSFLVKLTDVLNENQVWGQRYTGHITELDLIQILENIVSDVAVIIGSQYGLIIDELTHKVNNSPLRTSEAFDAVLKFYHYVATVTPRSAESALMALNSALDQDNSGLVHACLSIMHSDSYVFDEPIQEDSFELHGILAERAFELGPNSFLINTVLAVKHFIYEERQKFFDQYEKSIKMGPTWGLNKGTLAFHLMCYGEWEKGMKIMENVIKYSYKYPSFFHAATLLYYYRQKRFDKALTESDKLDTPLIFWAPMLRAAVMGQLGRVEEAGHSYDLLKQIKPDFEAKADSLISRFVKEPSLVSFVLEGLKQAGMPN